MELSRQEINQLHDQIGIDPLPGDYPALDKLIEAFGYQTFYLTGDGLHIFEYTDTPVDGGHEAVSVRIASWADEEKTDLSLHKPKLTGIKIHFAAALLPPLRPVAHLLKRLHERRRLRHRPHHT